MLQVVGCGGIAVAEDRPGWGIDAVADPTIAVFFTSRARGPVGFPIRRPAHTPATLSACPHDRMPRSLIASLVIATLALTIGSSAHAVGPESTQTLVTAGPALSVPAAGLWRSGGVDGALVRQVSPAVDLRFAGGWLPDLRLASLRSLTVARKALELGVELSPGARPYLGPVVALSVEGQILKVWPDSGDGERLASVGVRAGAGWRLVLGGDAALSLGLGVRYRPATWCLPPLSAKAPPVRRPALVLPAAEVAVGRWF